jgi:Pregnancy-associated plasma protein-A
MNEPQRRRGRLAAAGVVALAVAILTGALATGAAAAARPHGYLARGCDPVAAPAFADALTHVFAGASAARTAGGDFSVREKPQLVDSTEIPASSTPSTSSTFTGSVNVYFHVVAAGKSPKQGWVTQSQIDEQINVLNLTFGGFYGGDDSGFKFQLAGADWTTNQAWYDQATFDDEVAMKTELKRGGPTDLNIYSTSGGGFLGWSYLPATIQNEKYAVLDGVVVHSGSLPGGYVKNYNLGYTATHEVGHWLGLEHTFEKGCIGAGDYVDDTPAEATPTSGCPAGKDTCTAPGLDPIHNYMDYSYDSCYTQFTPGQSERMQEQWLHWRLDRA